MVKNDEIIFIFVNLSSLMFYLKSNHFNINVLNYFKYFQYIFFLNVIFIKKNNESIFVKMRPKKKNEVLDFQNWVSNDLLNQITLN